MKRVLLAGLLGGAVMLMWFIIVDGFLGFKRSIEESPFQNERTVYGFLAEQITEPGRYVLNPEVVPGQGFPGSDPIFAVHFTGLGHDDAGQEMLVGLLVMLLSCTAGAWLLTHSSVRVRTRYAWRLAFFVMIGLVSALLGVGARFGLATYALNNALALAVHDLAAWTSAGLVVASLVRPAREGNTECLDMQ